jgi:hypothetical protein
VYVSLNTWKFWFPVSVGGKCSREKIRPEQELQRAEAQILHSKLAIREAIHELDDLGLEGSLDENAFDSEGRIYHEEVSVDIQNFFSLLSTV